MFVTVVKPAKFTMREEGEKMEKLATYEDHTISSDKKHLHIALCNLLSQRVSFWTLVSNSAGTHFDCTSSITRTIKRVDYHYCLFNIAHYQVHMTVIGLFSNQSHILSISVLKRGERTCNTPVN